MATEYDLDLTADISALGTVTAADIATMVRTAVPDEKHGGILYGVNDPSVEDNPRYARYLLLQSDAAIPTKQPSIKTYDPVLKKWIAGTIPAGSVTNTQLAGEIELSKLKNVVENAGGYVLVVDTDGETIIPVAFVAGLLPTIPINKISLDGGSAYSVIRRNVDNNAWELSRVTYDMIDGTLSGSALSDISIPAGKYVAGSIVSADIADAAIDGDKIADNVINQNHISHDTNGLPYLQHKIMWFAGMSPKTAVSLTAYTGNTAPTGGYTIMIDTMAKHYTLGHVIMSGVAFVSVDTSCEISLSMFAGATLIGVATQWCHNYVYASGNYTIHAIPFYARYTASGTASVSYKLALDCSSGAAKIVVDGRVTTSPSDYYADAMGNNGTRKLQSWMQLKETNANDT